MTQEGYNERAVEYANQFSENKEEWFIAMRAYKAGISLRTDEVSLLQSALAESEAEVLRLRGLVDKYEGMLSEYLKKLENNSSK